MTAVAPSRLSLRGAARAGVSWWLGELAGVVPARFKERRLNRADADILLARDSWTVRDRRGATTVLDPRDGAAIAQAMAVLRGRRRQGKAVVVVPLSRCFVRRAEMPRAMLGYAPQILASELETATPFHTGTAHWDWFVHGAGSDPGTVAITQVVLKRRDTEALVAQLGEAGVAVAAIAVEDRTGPLPLRLPVDLQRHGGSSQADAAGLRKARAMLVGAALLTSAAIVPLAFSQQSATLAALDEQLADAKDAVALRPGLSRAPLEALAEALDAKRTNPPADVMLNALAAALPADSFLDHLFFDKDVLTIQGRTASIHNLEKSMAASPLFAAGHNTAAADTTGEGIAFTIRLKLKPLPAESEG